jgi:hypothetical protein
MAYDLHNPVDRVIAADEAADHAQARRRGQRVREIANLLIAALDGHAQLRDPEVARRVLYGALVDALYGNAAVDIDPRPGDRR